MRSWETESAFLTNWITTWWSKLRLRFGRRLELGSNEFALPDNCNFYLEAVSKRKRSIGKRITRIHTRGAKTHPRFEPRFFIIVWLSSILNRTLRPTNPRLKTWKLIGFIFNGKIYTSNQLIHIDSIPETVLEIQTTTQSVGWLYFGPQ